MSDTNLNTPVKEGWREGMYEKRKRKSKRKRKRKRENLLRTQMELSNSPKWRQI